MATIRELESKITLLEKGLKSKATKPALKVKMREQVSELKKKIKVLEKASDRGLDDVAKAKRLAKKKRSQQARQSTKDNDIESDANRYAINKTRRVSKGGRANQYGTKSENKGGVYYESRENRYDRQNKRYAKLGDGGETNQEYVVYGVTKVDNEVKVIKEVKSHKLADNFLQRFIDKGLDDEFEKMGFMPKAKFEKEKAFLKYADGGETYAKGGEISQYRITPYKRIEVANRPDFIEPYFSLAYSINGSLLEANESAQKYVRTNENIVSAVVTKIHQSGNAMKNKKVSYVTKDEIQKYADGGTTDVGGTQFSTEDLSGMFANGGETHRSEDGMYAQGGETSKYKHKIVLEIDKNNDSVYEGGEKFDVAIFTSKGDALMCVRVLQEKAPKYYHYRLTSN